LGRFLELNGIGLDDVTIVDTVDTVRTTEAIVNGDADAVVAFQPHVNTIQKRLGDAVLVWPVQNNQLVYGILVTRADWLAQSGDSVRRFIRALAEAEEYLVSHPDEASAIVRDRLKLDEAYVTSVWSQHQFGLSLDMSLVIAMNDEARWMIDNNLTSEKTVPDFKDYIYLDGLRAAKPEAVDIIR
jgi:NitT/TauT family transport system substrate-binding protein